MNDPNASNRFLTRRFNARRWQAATIGATLGLALGLSQLALAQDPIITLQPSSRTISEGESVILRAAATTTNAPISYQWQRDDPASVPLTFTNIPNAYRSSLNLQSVTLAQAGNYRVIVANAAGDFLDAYFNNGNWLCRNLDGSSFASMSSDQVGPILGSTWGGACWGDFDDDGWPDLYVPSLWAGECFIFRNQGAGRFVAVNNLITRTVSQAFKGAWGDYDNDGRLDLCTVNFNGTTTVSSNSHFDFGGR